jgi:hypothetical protein
MSRVITPSKDSSPSYLVGLLLNPSCCTQLLKVYADAHWKDFDFNNSNFGVVDGKKRSWGMLIKQYPFLEIDLQTMLGRWVKTQETQGLTTLGYKFTLPPPSQSK